MTRIALLSTSDTDLLSARASGADYGYADPARAAADDYLALAEGADLVVYRFLGSPQALDDGFVRLRGLGRRWIRRSGASCRGCDAHPTRSARCCTPWTAATRRPGRPGPRCAGW